MHYFISDLHLNHENIMRFCPSTRPYPNSSYMNRDIIRRINDVVGVKDTLWILGDVAFGNVVEALSWLRLIVCEDIRLIVGNHDRKNLRSSAEFENFFTEIHTEFCGWLHDSKNKKHYFHLYHFPVFEWDQMHRGSFHLYGHVHGNKIALEGRCMDVGFDAIHDNSWGYPISIDEVVKILSSREVRAHHD